MMMTFLIILIKFSKDNEKFLLKFKVFLIFCFYFIDLVHLKYLNFIKTINFLADLLIIYKIKSFTLKNSHIQKEKKSYGT